MIETPAEYRKLTELYRSWNEKVNVVSRKDIDNLYEHHILHSLAIAEYLRRFYPSVADGTDGRQSFLDVGTGGGFPGIPLAMEMPGADFTLCDSIGKKVRVAEDIASGMGLSNVRCVNARAESLPGVFDWVVSRAVTSLVNFYPWVRGKFTRSILYLKGGDIEAETAALIKVCKVPEANIRQWKISEWINNNEYFEEKFVIEIGKNYLCVPETE